MDELRLRAVKWSLFHRPLAAARLMAELSALLSSIMYFEKRRALTDNRCGVEHAGAGRLIVERLRRDKRRYKAGHGIRGYDQRRRRISPTAGGHIHQIKAG